jgi:hypothetical protein
MGADGFIVMNSNLLIHGSLIFQGEVGRFPSPWRKSPMDVNRSQLGLFFKCSQLLTEEALLI